MGIKKIGSFFSEAGNAAKNAIDKAKEKAILAVDQNGDGKLDLADLSIVVDTVSDAVKKGASSVMDNMEESRKAKELKTLQPIFPRDLYQTDFILSKLIHVVDRDRKYLDSQVCKGSIGFLSDKGGLRIVNIFKDSLDEYGLTFFPDIDCEFYYVNPADRKNYIFLDDYFSHLKTVRINELQRVAQALGAIHFRVTYKEEKTVISEVRGKTQVKAAPVGSAEGAHDATVKEYAMIDVAAEMTMDGHAPQIPQLVYLQNDDTVQSLIHFRMTGGEGFRHHKLTIKLSNSSGLKESDAVKIEATIKGLKGTCNSAVASEAKSESHRYLEYEIDF